jgi:hypothetical protein
MNLPNLNNPYQSSVAKNSALGNRVKSLPPGAPGQTSGGGIGGYIPGQYKYSGIGGGIGGGIGSSMGGGIGDSYGVQNEQSIQGA